MGGEVQQLTSHQAVWDRAAHARHRRGAEHGGDSVFRVLPKPRWERRVSISVHILRRLGKDAGGSN